jgi:3-deoxy-D-manno-octulosonic-acid transferase
VRRLYTVLFYLILPWIALRLLWRSYREPAYRARFLERLGFYPVRFEKTLWVHAVSLGEVIAAIPLIQACKAGAGDLPIVVTTMTPSGAARVQAALGNTVTHLYLPYDLPDAIHRFLNAVRPIGGIIMETELWPNLIHACAKRDIPVCLMNARLSEKSLLGYQRVKSGMRKVLQQFAWIAANSQADAERFMTLGASAARMSVTGNIKFDATIPERVKQESAHFHQQLGEHRLIWVAASTHAGEDEQILSAHQQLLKQYPTALLILVPRHPSRFDAVYALCQQTFTVHRRSQLHAPLSHDVQVLLGDTMGELLLMYSVADVAFVGGSLIPHGGHNPIEPALFSKPILTGPHIFNFTDIGNQFTAAHAIDFVTDSKTLFEKLNQLMASSSLRQEMGSRAAALVEANRGVLARQYALTRQCLLDKL